MIRQGVVMRKFVTLAFIGVFAVSVASCGNSQGSNSASNLEVDSLVGPSALEARSPSAGGGKGGGKGGGGTTSGGGSLSMVMVTDNAPSGTSIGDRVTFTVSTTATEYPWVTVRCYQSGDQVYAQSNGIFPTSLGQTFTIGPTPSWQSGGADCTATLENWDGRGVTALASISFQAVG
jgi:hypothetical protein